MKKRIVSFLMALVMAVSLLPVSAFAVEDGDSLKEPSQQNENAEAPLPISTYANATYYPTITYIIDGKKVDYTTSSKDSIGQWKEFATALNFADIFVVSIPAGAEINSISIPNTENYYVGLEVAGSSDWMDEFTSSSENYPTLSEIRGEVGFVSGTDFRSADDSDDAYGYAYNISELDEETIQKIPAVNVEGYMLTCYIKYSQNGLCIAAPGIIVQYASGGESADTTELANEVARVTGENAKNWHQTNDKWNGKTWSEKGFWNELTAPLAIAQELVEKGGSELAVKDAAAALQAAIANLIPTDRVNATALYEALHTDWRWYYGGLRNDITNSGDPVSADNCTPLSWQPYAKAVKDGQALLDKLYENGAPTDENTDAMQETVDRLAAVADAHKLVNKEAYAAAYDKYMAAKPEAEALLKQYAPTKLTERDFTADSWKTYTDAYAALEADVAYRIVGGTTEDWKMLQGFNGYYAYDDAGQWTHYIAHIEALKNTYRALTSGVDVTVSFTYLNNFSALYPSFGGTSLYANSSLTLAAGSTDLAGLMAQAGLTFDLHAEGSIRGGCDTIPYFLLLVNGENFGVFSQGQIPQKAVQFHHGDDIRMFRIQSPLEKTEASSGYDSTAIFTSNAVDASSYRDSIALINMKTPADVKVGDKAKLSATVIGADLFNLGQSKSAAGITLFISDPSETKALSQPIHKTAAVTGADGSLQYVFTRPGWYTVAMFNVTPDDLTFTDVYQATTIGEYYSLYGGDYALIHVTAADDADALLKQYRAEKAAEAKAYFDSFHDYDFTAEGYAALKAQYETLTANLEKAADLTALMDTYDADFARLKELGAAVIDHAAVIAELRQNLSYLPDDLNGLNANYKQLVQDIQTVYGGLNSYQKKLLSANETKRLDAVAKIDAGSLKAPAKVTLEVDVDENQLPMRMVDTGNPYYGLPNIKWVVTPNVDGTVPAPKDWAYPSFGTAKVGDHAFIRYYLDTTDEKYWPVWSVDGGNTWNLMEPQTLVTPNDEKKAYDHYYLAEYVIPDDVVNGSTITFKVKMISKTEYQAMTADSADAVAAAQAAALAHLETVKNGLKGSFMEKKYQAGVKAIQAATSVAAVESAYQAAVKNMQAAATGFGKVHVIVENTTFTSDMWPRGEEYWDGTLVNTWVDLKADSTMMSCIVDALTQKGYTQVGAESNYIATINGLSEKDGNAKSGWMGTLNDWFTNYGFGAFSVAEGDLSDGDVIRVMYTNNTSNDNAGADLGGTWGNKNTTLSDLTVSGGQLLGEFVPGQSGGTYEYTLAIDSAEANIQVTPTAANKNYLTKIFLNEKVTDNTEGFSFYKRTQSIPVKAGDVIYVGCGENGWPTMNGSGQRGTWYVLRVIDVNADASAVTGMINDLPEVSAVKYGNYQLYMNAVAAARASFNALSKEQQKLVDTTELEKLEAAIAQFQAIDEVKDQLDKLPGAGDLTIEDQEAVKAAKEAYDKLSDEQKAEMTGLEIDKMGELTTRMDEIVKDNSKPNPGKPGNGGNNSSAKNPYQKDNGKDVKSGNTGDAGVTLYMGMGLVAVLAGAVIVTRKRKEN